MLKGTLDFEVFGNLGLGGDWAAESCWVLLRFFIGGSFFNVCSCEFGKIDERLADGGIGVIKVIIKFGEFFGVEADAVDADLG